MTKRLYRSKTDKKISGVCGGMADYFAIDPVIVRLLWVLGTLMSLFLGVAAYIACAFILKLRHSVQLTHIGVAVQNPSQLCMLWHMRLIINDILFRV